MEENKWMIEPKQVSTRLDKFLLENIDDVSRTRIQQWITNGDVMVNGEISKSNYKVRLHDVITLDRPEDVEYDLTPVDMNLDIVYEDHDIIVLNKPKGVVVHPGAGTKEVTLVHGLLYHCQDLSGINGVLRPGIVHRIDKDTSGLLVVAKNDKAHVGLSEQLVDKTMSRKYYALVHGELAHDHGTIDAPIGRDEKDRQKMTVTDKNSKQAITEFFVKERFKGFTLVECHLKTGRTHQIRVHMQYIKHPVVGDPKYSYRKPLTDHGQLLHAFELTLIHPITEERMTFTAPLPAEFQEILQSLREGKEIRA
ncbi:MAG: RluA family pseudouridine synthase [Erysipelotrichaceae bacterium]|nr:RluA family pseudouridine synthase [Erysipelotrichaceae bacterium]